MSSNNFYDVIIVGTGPAGYSAAIYAARASLKTLVLTGGQQGGQLTTTDLVENYAGFAKPIDGIDLMMAMAEQTENVGAKIDFDTITDVDFSKKPFTLVGEMNSYTANSVILATGASANWLGLESEEKYKNKGVSACATCDGFFYKGKVACVVGGGNTAVEEAIYLSNICSEVNLICRRDFLKGEKILHKRINEKSNIKVHFNSVTDEIIGDDKKVTSIKIKNKLDNSFKTISTDAVFIAIGHSPRTAFLNNSVDVDSAGYVIVKNNVFTSKEGVFAAGDVCDKIYRQAITSAGAGAMAALEVERYLDSLKD